LYYINEEVEENEEQDELKTKVEDIIKKVNSLKEHISHLKQVF
jgi:DNA-binding transcriptional regulator GbsR (MarR family)